MCCMMSETSVKNRLWHFFLIKVLASGVLCFAINLSFFSQIFIISIAINLLKICYTYNKNIYGTTNRTKKTL